MNDLINNLQLINEVEKFNIVEFSISITLAIITSFVLKFTYEEKSRSLSSEFSSVISISQFKYFTFCLSIEFILTFF